MSFRHESAASYTIAVITLLAITVILAMLVLLVCLGFRMPAADPAVPVIFKIASVTYNPDTDGIHVRGYVVITNTRDENYRNRYLKVVTYVNDKLADCSIPTLNNDLFDRLDHHGVWHLVGVGTWGNRDFQTSVWPGHSDIAIEYAQGIMHPEDSVTLEFIDTTTDQIISRDTYPHTTNRDAQWFYNYFLTHQGA